jgi:hypothetical protein
MKENDTLEKDLSIDKYKLDDEWSKQPDLYHAYGAMLADAENERDRAKEFLDLTEATVSDIIRRTSEKTTETSIKNQVLMHEDYKEAMRTYLEKKNACKHLQVVISALEHKKSALENLVKLFLSDYYSEPSVPKVARDKAEEVQRDIETENLNNNPRMIKRRIR